MATVHVRYLITPNTCTASLKWGFFVPAKKKLKKKLKKKFAQTKTRLIFAGPKGTNDTTFSFLNPLISTVMNIQKYYDADGNATHYVCRVLLSFHNTVTPWMERVRQATHTNVALVKNIELQYMSGVHRANGTGEASVWLMIPADREVSSVLHTIADFSNRLGIDGITAAVAIFDLNYLTSKKIDQ